MIASIFAMMSPSGPELIIIFFLLISLIPLIFFLLTLQKCLERCDPLSRAMNPSQVWLMLIPFFNLIWQFIVVSRIATSLDNEFKRRNIIKEPNPGKSLGIAWCVLGLCSIIPTIGTVIFIIGLICWIVYWTKIASYSSEIATQFST